MYILFVDLKAAFDSIDRKTLWKVLEEKDLGGRMIRRIRRMYEDTRVVVRIEEGIKSPFRMRKGVRQGCVMSPLLFNLYIADLDKYMAKRGIGGVKLGEDRIWLLAYADDMVLLARNREALMDMIGTLRKFLKDRRLELNTEKTKVVVFNKKGRERKEVWKWEGKEMEEAKNFKYLGFMFNRKGDYGEHIKELKIKGRIAANKVWGLGERICRNGFNKRWKLFRYLVVSVMAYGVEIWGWKEQKDLEKIMLDYVRWVFRLDFCTPRYVITRELRLDGLKVKWGIRARRFEVKIGRMEDERWVKKCWEEKRKGGWKDKYGMGRESYYNRNEWGILAIEGREEENRDFEEELMRRERDVQRQTEDSRIRDARYM